MANVFDQFDKSAAKPSSGNVFDQFDQPAQDAQGEPILSMNEQPHQRPRKPEPSLMDEAIGVGEAFLTTATGATAGTAGSLIGTIEGIVQAAREGKIGEPEAAQIIQQRAAELGGYGTYQPRTQQGQEYVQAIGEIAGALPPVIAGVNPAQATGMQQSLGRTAQVAASNLPIPTSANKAMGGLSVGAAEIPKEQVRVERANELPVPLGGKLTKGMRTQDFSQQKFENETAKNPEFGAQLRDRYIELNEGINQNIDAFLDATGTTITDKNWRSQTGNKVVDALSAGYRAEKAKVDNAYNAARAKGETQQVIHLDTLNDYLNSERGAVEAAPILKSFEKEAFVREVGEGSLSDGTFKLKPMTIDQAEELRQRVNALVDVTNKQDSTRARQIKSLIDEAQDQGTGSAFQSARKQRQQLANKYENLAIIDKLLDTQGNYTDQRIAAESVIDRAVIGGTVQDVRNLRRVLSTAGEAGLEALNEVRSAVVRHIRDEATSNVGRDPNDNPIISFAKLNKSINQLDEDGKLDLLFGKAEADKWRVLRDVARDIKVTQPNAVNTSNTASNIAQAVDLAMSAGFMLPLPVMTTLKAARDKAKAAAVQKRVKESLK